MRILKSKLDEWNFFPTHRCVKNSNGALKFELLKVAPERIVRSDKPMVYLWLNPISEDLYEVLYVGKAGLGVTNRLRGHENGFKNSVPGQKNAREILSLITQEKEVLVFARKAEVIEVLGRSINAYSAEEESIHDQYAPAWNRAVFAGGRRSLRETEGGKSANNTSVVTTQNALPLPEEKILNFDFSDVLEGNVVSEFFEGLALENQNRFEELIRWMTQLNETKDLPTKIVRGYTDQPAGYNMVATILISTFRDNGRAFPGGWRLRIPLRADDKFPLSVTLNKKYLSAQLSQLSKKDTERYIAFGAKDNFRPINLDHFLQDPGFYTILT